MKKKHISMQAMGVCIVIVLWISGCCTLNSGNTGFRFSSNDSQKIAVLDFEEQGFLGGEKLGRFAAEELTTALFIKQNLKVVDRAQVTAIMVETQFSPSILDVKSIQQLGEKLESDYLILGCITRFDKENFDPETNGRISVQITIRIISTRNGEVVGMISRQSTKKEEPKIIVGKMVEAMAGFVRFK